MADPDLKALAERLAMGESLETALGALQPDPRSELLKRCAAVHQFDAELLEVLRSAPPALAAVELSELAEDGAVEPVPGSEGTYRLPRSERREQYARWWSDDPAAVIPDGLRSVSARVLDYLEGREGREVETLYQRLIVDTPDALNDFEDAFDAADGAFDLAHCQDLLDVLDERLPLLGPEAAAVGNRRRRRLRARAMWLRDWHSSSRFMLPAPSEAATTALIEGDDVRVLNVWAAGGMGKSSFLRWLTARRCAPYDHACARIDFDDIDALVATQEPSLILLEAAHQLDQQLADAPYHELLAQYTGQRARLTRRASTSSSLEPAADEIRERFTDALSDLPPSPRVVIMLDTLEVALLLGGAASEPTDLAPLFEPLAKVLEDAPVLRLVLTSRYDLAERVQRFDELFPSARSVPLEPFSESDARRYLEGYRGITRPEVVDRIVAGAGGIPFKLELIADVAEAQPDLDPAELTQYADANLAYVVDRVVNKLDPALRDLLRYGVVPRTLDRRFVDDVLAPLLGASDQEIDELWRALKRYAGSASWVTLDPVQTDAVRFLPTVLEPMRRLLRDDPRHDELQRSAEAWFERRAAAAAPGDATGYICQAVFHRFQHAGPGGKTYWESWLDAARVERRAERRRAVAAEVLGPDYLDEDGTAPLPWRDGQPLLSSDTLLRARWELAFAAVQLAQQDSPERRDGERLEAERALADVERLRGKTGGSAVTDHEMALLRAGLGLAKGDLVQAKREMDKALPGRLAGEDRLWLWLAYAGAVSSRGDERAARHFSTALSLAKRSGRREADLAAVYHRLALHHAEHDRIEDALSACEHGARHAEGLPALELSLVHAQLEMRRGAPTVALELLPTTTGEEPEVQARRAIVRIRALLESGHPQEALAAALDASSRYGTTLQHSDARRQRVAAEGRELRGKVRAQLLDVQTAVADFKEAADRWDRLGAADGVCRCRVRAAALYLRGVGNLHQASVLLDEARGARALRGQDAWTRRTLVGADLLARSGEAPRAAHLVDDVIEALRANERPPRAFVAAAVQGLAVTEGSDQDRYLELLRTKLAQVTPPSARLSLLDGLEGCATATGSRALCARVRQVVPSPVREASRYAHVPPRDLALLSIRDAELDRILGRADRARPTLERAWDALTPDPSRAAVHRLVGAAVRADANVLLRALADRELSVIQHDTSFPVLDGTAVVQAAAALEPSLRRSNLLEVADTLLDRHAAVAGAWPAELLELHAEEAEANELAHHLRRRAAEIYAGLGDNVRRDRALPDQARGGVPSEPVDEHEVRVTVRVREGTLTVLAEAREGPLAGPEGGVRSCPLVEEVLAGAEGAPASGALVARLLDDPMGLGEELASLLLDALPSGRKLDVGLRAKDAVVRALPWELASPALEAAGLRLFRRAPRTRGWPADVRGVQGALNRERRVWVSPDGIFGTDTREALQAFQSDGGLPATGMPDPVTVQRLHAAVAGGAAPRVTIVRRSWLAEERTFRGARQSGVLVDWLYRRAGFRPLVLDSPTSDELMAALQRWPPAILHLNVGLVATHGSPAVDVLALPTPKGRPLTRGRLTATALDRLIPRNLPAPLVLLDVPAPKGRREAVRQLLLRNVFAAELSAVGTAPAILATGLAADERQRALYATVIGALRVGRDVGDVRAAIAALADVGSEPALADRLAFTAAALFARRPSIRFPAPA